MSTQQNNIFRYEWIKFILYYYNSFKGTETIFRCTITQNIYFLNIFLLECSATLLIPLVMILRQSESKTLYLYSISLRQLFQTLIHIFFGKLDVHTLTFLKINTCRSACFMSNAPILHQTLCYKKFETDSVLII